jgi:hypothetical protein
MVQNVQKEEFAHIIIQLHKKGNYLIKLKADFLLIIQEHEKLDNNQKQLKISKI